MGPRGFALVALGIAAGATALAVSAPISFSLGTVFLFAGPHNWIEARYVLARLPSRWGPLSGYFSLGAAGVVILSASSAALPAVARLTTVADSTVAGLSLASWSLVWNLALVAWVAALLVMRSRQKPRRDWWWVIPAAALTGAALSWQPLVWSLALVYLHPFVAFWILDRELLARRRHWRPVYHAALASLPLFVGILWWQLGHAAPLPGTGLDALTLRLVRHSGGGLIPWLPAHFLIALHAVLETLHYAVWLVAIPAVTLGNAPWKLARLPLAARSRARRGALALGLAVSACLVVALWMAFAANYAATRDLYFTVAIVHVLAEAPLLVRLA